MKIHDRIRKILSDENLSISEFERTLGVGQNSISTCLRRTSSVGHHVLVAIKQNYPQYSLDWLLTGEEAEGGETKEIISTLLGKLQDLEKDLKRLEV